MHLIHLLTYLWVVFGVQAAVLLRSASEQVTTPVVLDSTKNITYHGTSLLNTESFLNIRFGQSTGGQNRFASPKPFTYTRGAIVNASLPGAACPQQKVPLEGFALFQNVTDPSEDCLTLRVDRPAGTSNTSDLPVMIWIYGGGNAIGQIYDSAYDPSGLVENAQKRGTPIVYVAMNYRLGFFGFSAIKGAEEAGSDAVLNAGLLDQRLAFEWVQDNIALFGGDPKNVTIFGESAGASSVGQHLLSNSTSREHLPFHRAIMESGGPTGNPNTTGSMVWDQTAQLVSILKCSNSNSTAELDCLRKIPLEDLLSAATNFTLNLNPLGGFNIFGPVSPSQYLPIAPSTALLTGNFSTDIDVIIGWNEDDGALFVPSPDQFPNDSSLAGYLGWQFPGINTSQVNEALALYPTEDFEVKAADFPLISINWFRASQMNRDYGMTCPSVLLVESIQAANKGAAAEPTTYLYNLNSTVYRTFLAQANSSFLGVIHFSDVPYIFNIAAEVNASQSDIDLAKAMSGSWAQFATDGKTIAAASSQGLTIANWPEAVNGTGNTYAATTIGGPDPGPFEFGGNTADFQRIAERCAFWNRKDMLALLQT